MQNFPTLSASFFGDCAVSPHERRVPRLRMKGSLGNQVFVRIVIQERNCVVASQEGRFCCVDDVAGVARTPTTHAPTSRGSHSFGSKEEGERITSS